MATLIPKSQLRDNGSDIGKDLKHSPREMGEEWHLLKGTGVTERKRSRVYRLSIRKRELSAPGTGQACESLVDEEVGGGRGSGQWDASGLNATDQGLAVIWKSWL